MEIKNSLLQQTDAYRASMEESRKVAARRAAQASPEAASKATGDRVSVSPEAMLRTEAHKAISSAPEVRQEKVNEIKERIANGSYSVDSQSIARKLLESDAFLSGSLQD